MNGVLELLAGRRILVTGGSGYLAYNLISRLRNVDCHVVRLHRTGANLPPMAGKVKIADVEADIKDPKIWASILPNIDAVFHFAAQTSVYLSEQAPLEDLSINVLPMLNLLETCRKMELSPAILFAGTATEVGLPLNLPVDEFQRDNPITMYDIHKLVAENYLKLYTMRGMVKGVVLRLANVYGPGPKSSSADRGVLNLMIRRALNCDPLTIYGEGAFVRDYIYVEDVINAFLAALVNIDKVAGRHYVIGSEQEYTIADAFNLVADRVALRTGKKPEVINITPPATLSLIEERNFVADTTSFKSATNWRAETSLLAGIDRTIESYLSDSVKG